ncbi:MAG TPA: carboxypeptidase regulatory-like domain-containing protein [Pyrinomonadaceae bacterium]|jgi:plastocyanin|nr:carboxypeptidase regulatory-like domain-containing protein [Pyrinomonadaceae bacterium]
MLKKRARFWLAIFALLSLLAFSYACGGKKETAESGDNTSGGDAPAATAWTAKGDEGSITGKVTLNGDAPAPQKIDMAQDANCASKNPNAVTETLVAKDGKLQYVFVYIKDGTLADGKKITDYTFKTPDSEVVLDQNGCHYVPHVIGMQPNQKLKVTNSDPTGHNIHALPAKDKGNEEWNESQPSGAPPIVDKTFKRSEILVPVKCNQHPWMKAYIGVVKHPFFAVSKEDGTFEIKGVPPGTYTVAAWQEKGGGGKGTEKTMQVTVPAKGAATADFAFDVAALTASVSNGSLEMMPAIELPMLMNH